LTDLLEEVGEGEVDDVDAAVEEGAPPEVPVLAAPPEPGRGHLHLRRSSALTPSVVRWPECDVRISCGCLLRTALLVASPTLRMTARVPCCRCAVTVCACNCLQPVCM
jgi:hypothetical protein